MFLKHNFYGILWALLILFVCTLPSNEFPKVSSLKHLDKGIHFFLYAQFSIFLIVGFKKQFQYRKLRNHAIGNAFSISFVYGILIEILQNTFFSSRSFEMFDILANFSGTIFGLMMFLILYGKTSK